MKCSLINSNTLSNTLIANYATNCNSSNAPVHSQNELSIVHEQLSVHLYQCGLISVGDGLISSHQALFILVQR